MMHFTHAGVRLAYEETGTGLPVILLHGFPFSHQMWRPQALLARAARLITPDLRGFGESGGTPASLDELADDLHALVEHLRLPAVVFGGFSMGGYVLFRYLARHADRAKAVLLLDTRAGPIPREGGSAATAGFAGSGAAGRRGTSTALANWSVATKR